MVPSVDEFEKLGVFYLGRKYDLAAGSLRDELVLYDSKDLCTHALCVGMTGSGKTGLCLALLEEAAIDNIPVICIDPKGDLGNLLLTFPELRPADFEPWLEKGEATRKGKTVEELAEETAQRWRDGLAKWGQGPDRIKRLRDQVDIAIYTPGSNAGIPLTVLRSFDAPSQQVLDDADAMRERVGGAASGLLTLLGIDADPLLSREHILISSILDQCWRTGRSISIAEMIGLIQSPPFERVGVLDLNSFMPLDQRVQLAMRLNNLLASPSFATWLEGESLDIHRLMYTAQGKPRISILSIAHLSDAERMFFVTILLNELLSWMRSQSGTSSLRAIFYMDEVFGYFPPSAKPPSKQPMMTLLKQARAFGLGITLATQNPVDLDYKGLSNIGTWFLGRLQTERDKQRVLEGLEGAAAQSGHSFDRAQMEQTLAALGNRVFLMNNVHDDRPTIFQTRWAMSFLAGPLARGQISQLMDPRKQTGGTEVKSQREPLESSKAMPGRPIAPAGVEEQYLVARGRLGANSRGVYRPALLAQGSLHYVRDSAQVDLWRDERRLLHCGSGLPARLWEASVNVNEAWDFATEPESGFEFCELPTELCSQDNFKQWAKDYKEYLYRHCPLVLYKSPILKQFAPPGTAADEARLAFSQEAREARDRETEKLRAKYASRMEAIDRRIRTAQEKLAREQQQLKDVSVTSVVDLGTSILGSLFGNKRRSSSSRTGSLVRGATKAAQEREDVVRAEANLKELSLDMMDIDQELRQEIDKIAKRFAIENLELDETVVAPRKSDLKVDNIKLVWTPWQLDAQGIAEPLF